MKLAPDYSLRDYWKEEIQKHIEVLGCTYEEALQVLAWDIMCEEHPEIDILTDDKLAIQKEILQQIGIEAHQLSRRLNDG